IMDYLFRWMQLRFLSGHQFDLFAGMHPTASAPAAVAAPSGPLTLDPGPSPLPEPHTMLGDAFENTDRTPPQQGIAPDLQASNGLASSGSWAADPKPFAVEDRSHIHASD